MKNEYAFSRPSPGSVSRSGLFRRLLLPAGASLLLIFGTSCVERPAPEQVTAAYFETVAQGDMFALRPFLTPDGQEILDQMAAVPELRTAMETQREAQKQFWTGVVRSVSRPAVEGSRAVVDFTAEVPGRGRASCRIVLFLIDGEWKISSTSISGLQADRFRNELMALKMPPAPKQEETAGPGKNAVQEAKKP